MTQPRGYRGPHDPVRDPDQVMADVAAQNLIAEIIQLHQQLHDHLDADVKRAAHPPTEPASGKVTGSGEWDRIDDRVIAVRQAEAERGRQLAAAREMLRRVVRYYEIRLGQRKPPPVVVESIDYRNGGTRRVGFG